MIKKIDNGVFLVDGRIVSCDSNVDFDENSARKGTMAFKIMSSHNVSGNERHLSIRFDSVVAHDMTYIGVLQTAIACGITKFNIPFVMTDCHNSLCAMSGTFNEDDHIFSLSAAKRFGGIKVPSHLSIIHQYMREMYAGGGTMILGADSHTRYGALGTLAIGEGAGELVKQLVGKTYDIDYPETVLIYLTGSVKPGVGPHDVALSLIGSVFSDGFVKNRILEFCGPGIGTMSVDFRNGIDVMTTEASCLSSIWETDSQVEEFLSVHGRVSSFRELHPDKIAYYDRAVIINLSEIESVIAMPFHPSNVYTISEFNTNAGDILRETEKACNKQMEGFSLRYDFMSKLSGGRFRVDQGVVAGCAGGLFSNLCAVADIVKGHSIGNDSFSMHVYTASLPVMKQIVDNGVASDILGAGIDLRSSFCGPCFGAGDIPGQMGFSVRHTTRNFANRDGSRPLAGQLSAVALMDARSIAATAINDGFLTAATSLEDIEYRNMVYSFDSNIYRNRVLDLFGKGNMEEPLIMGPNIKPIPQLPVFRKHLLCKVCANIPDRVTTTDELIPGGESTSYRSNLLRLAEYALCTREPQYVPRSKSVRAAITDMDKGMKSGTLPELGGVIEKIRKRFMSDEYSWNNVTLGSVLVSRKPGDGSAREYAATCQRMLGGVANVCVEYATKRYRSNLINWGIVPFTSEQVEALPVGAYLFVPDLRSAVESGSDSVPGYVIDNDKYDEIRLSIGPLLPQEREILLAGCLINYYKQ